MTCCVILPVYCPKIRNWLNGQFTHLYKEGIHLTVPRAVTGGRAAKVRSAAGLELHKRRAGLGSRVTEPAWPGAMLMSLPAGTRKCVPMRVNTFTILNQILDPQSPWGRSFPAPVRTGSRPGAPHPPSLAPRGTVGGGSHGADPGGAAPRGAMCRRPHKRPHGFSSEFRCLTPRPHGDALAGPPIPGARSRPGARVGGRGAPGRDHPRN